MSQKFLKHIITLELCTSFIYRSTMNFKGSLLASGVHRSSTNLLWIFETHRTFFLEMDIHSLGGEGPLTSPQIFFIYIGYIPITTMTNILFGLI